MEFFFKKTETYSYLLKIARLPPIFFLDFNNTCQNLLKARKNLLS